METMVQTMHRLGNQGFNGQFRAESGGLRFLTNGTLYQPEELTVEEMVRLEGNSTPDEEAVIFALVTPLDEKATYCVTYGPEMDPADMDVVRRLHVSPSERT